MSQLKILLLQNRILTQHTLVETLRSLGHHTIYVATTSKEANRILQCEKYFDVLIYNVSADHTQELSFIRKANDNGHIHSFLLISEAEQSIRHAIQQLARLWGYQVIGALSQPICNRELEKALSNHEQIPAKKSLHLTEMFSASDIKIGIQQSQFTPYYQPKFNLETMQITGAEVLTRWHHPVFGIVSPAAFLDVARHFDCLDEMMVDISRKALRFLSGNETFKTFGLSINVDTSQLCNPDFHKNFRHLLTAENVDASRVTLEITEEGLIDSPANCLENLINLRLLGCGISIDDFGAGLSSLQRICELPCTEIKLDMSFTRALGYNEKSRAAIQNMINLSSHIGTNLVVEGIEQQEQVNILRTMNCNIGQGYFFSPPITGDELTSMLKKENSKNNRFELVTSAAKNSISSATRI